MPLTCDEKDEDNLNLLGCVQTIFTQASNNVCSTSHPLSYSVHSYKPKKLVNLFPMSPHIKMSNLTESFECKVYNLRVEIIEQLQASNG